jgi:serine/threonine-protein kinase RsbW
VFPGEERELVRVRRLASLLPESPARDDLATVATELCGNTIRHTASGRGGWFAVEITWYGPVVRVAVADGGGPGEPRVIEDLSADSGRGLLLVRGLSVRTGVSGDQRGRLVWADVRWEGGDRAAAGAPGDPYEAAIRDGEAALARRFGGLPAWFGRSTLQWWALPDRGGLVSAPSAAELAALLYRLDAERLVQSAAAGRSGQRARVGRGSRPGGIPGRVRGGSGRPHPRYGRRSLASGTA